MGGLVAGPVFTPTERIERPGGEILKVMKAQPGERIAVGEAYFSTLEPNATRGWKRHAQMTVRAFVPTGQVKFVVVSELANEEPQFEEFILGPNDSYGCLAIPPGNWFGFQGGAAGGVVLNMASIPHDPKESENAPLERFNYQF